MTHNKERFPGSVSFVSHLWSLCPINLEKLLRSSEKRKKERWTVNQPPTSLTSIKQSYVPNDSQHTIEAVSIGAQAHKLMWATWHFCGNIHLQPTAKWLSHLNGLAPLNALYSTARTSTLRTEYIILMRADFNEFQRRTTWLNKWWLKLKIHVKLIKYPAALHKGLCAHVSWHSRLRLPNLRKARFSDNTATTHFYTHSTAASASCAHVHETSSWNATKQCVTCTRLECDFTRFPYKVQSTVTSERLPASTCTHHQLCVWAVRAAWRQRVTCRADSAASYRRCISGVPCVSASGCCACSQPTNT